MAIIYPQAEDPRLQNVQAPVQVNQRLPQYPSATTDYTGQIVRQFYDQGGIVGPAMDALMRPHSAKINDFVRQSLMRDYDAARESRRLAREQAQTAAAVAPEASMREVLPSDAEAVVSMEKGGLVKQAQRVQNQGRHGDSMLVHMNPDEYRAMTALGGLGGLAANQVTINPETGLPEMFSFKDILPTIVGVAGAAFGLPTWAFALGTGATTAITTGDIGKGLMAGLGSYALGSLMDTFGPAGVDPANTTNIATNAAGQANVAGGGFAPFDAFEYGTSLGGGTPIPAGQVGQFSNVLPRDLSSFGAPFNPQATRALGVDLSPTFVGDEGFRAAALAGRGLTQGGITYGPQATRSIAAGLPAVKPPMMNTTFPANPAGTSEALSRLNAVGAREAARAADPSLTTGQLGNVFQESYKQNVYDAAPWMGDATTRGKFDYLGEGISKIGEKGYPGYFETGAKALTGVAGLAGGAGYFDPPEYENFTPGQTLRKSYIKPDIEPLDRTVNLEGFDPSRVGLDPQFSFFAKGGKKGNLETVNAQSGYSDVPMAQQGIVQPNPGQGPATPQRNPQVGNMQSAIMQAAREVASNTAAPAAPAAPRPRGMPLTPGAMANLIYPSGQAVRMQEGGVPSEEMMAQQGIMDVASEEVKNNLNERMSVTPSADQPQNPEERAIYDRAMLAVQGMLEPEDAQMAIREFIETFGPEAYNMIMELARSPRDEGGVVKPANGDTTVADGAIQGEDVIAGKIVDPDTGEETANLRVGENEYIEPADSLSRRAMAAGLDGTPENGALVRGMEEEQLRQAFG